MDQNQFSGLCTAANALRPTTKHLITSRASNPQKSMQTAKPSHRHKSGLIRI
ncbi:Hypothetical protein FKW44_013434 [Caligus rogercresseyi]|uniref:Uncharacterized protein n=1 Tax=Caligus rogercresseyi TaxID=217165 RepID=A0A7T8HL54_CALRO|nr:Hypothetical protein FKW44_013434 [Caligus rogercresseyi]